MQLVTIHLFSLLKTTGSPEKEIKQCIVLSLFNNFSILVSTQPLQDENRASCKILQHSIDRLLSTVIIVTWETPPHSTPPLSLLSVFTVFPIEKVTTHATLQTQNVLNLMHKVQILSVSHTSTLY